MKNLLTSLFCLSLFIGNLQSQNAGNDCGNAPTFIIGPESSTVSITTDWPSLSSSGASTTSPATEQNSNLTYSGKDAWISFESGNIQYLKAETNNNKNFNLYGSCGSNKISTTTIENVFNSVVEVYELDPNTTYFIQVLRLEDFNLGEPITTAETVITMQRSIPNVDCSTSITVDPNAAESTFNTPIRAVDGGRYFFTMNSSVTKFVSFSTPCIVYRNDCSISGLIRVNGLRNSYVEIEAGTDYYVAHRPESSYQENLTFTFVDIPVNDVCTGRISINYNEQVSFSSRYFKTEEPFSQNPSAFYSFVASGRGIYLDGGSFSRPSVYSNSCTDPEKFSPNADDKIYGLTPGNEYIVASATPFTINNTTAPVLNNNCGTAQSVSVNGISRTVDMKYTSPSRSSNLPDIWYALQSPPNMIQIDFTNIQEGSSTTVKLWVGATCDDLVEIASLSGRESYSPVFNTPALPTGTNYYLSIEKSLRQERESTGSWSGFGSFRIVPQAITFSINSAGISGTAPENDNCAGALALEEGLVVNNVSLASILESGIPTCTDADPFLASSWYTFTTSADSLVYDIPNSTTLYSGSCTSLVLEDCPKTGRYSYRSVVLPPNTTYLIKSTEGIPQIFENAQVDKDCSSAETLSPLFEFERLPYLRDRIYNSEDPDVCYGGNDNNGGDVWFSIETNSSINHLVLTRNRTPSIISIYSGTCGNLSEVYCDRLEDVLNIPLSENSTYLMRVTGEAFRINYKFNEVEYDIDDCATARNISITSTPTELNRSTSATVSTPSSDCINSEELDVWYEFNAPANGTIGVETNQPTSESSEEAYFVEIYSDCNTPTSYCSQEDYVIFDGLTPGSTYYLRTNSIAESGYVSTIYTPGGAASNSSCASGTAITEDGCQETVSGYTFDMVGGAWYNTSMPASGALDIRSNGNSTFYIYVGDCMDLVLYDSLTTESNLVVEGIPSSETIHINVKQGSRFEFCISALSGSIHENTVCDYSTPLSNIDLLSCTNPNSISIDQPYSYNGPLHLWYSFTASAMSMNVSSEITASYISNLTELAVYDACDGNRIAFSNGAVSSELSGLTIGQDYFIKLTTVVSSTDIEANCQGDEDCLQNLLDLSYINLDLCLIELMSPAVNDLCSNAMSVSISDANCSQAVADSTHQAFDDQYGCRGSTRELWYTFSSSNSENLLASVTGNNAPLNIAIYDGACDERVIACGVDSTNFVAHTGVDYYVSVSIDANLENTNYSFCVKALESTSSEGNVGVGVDNPIEKLQVDGAVNLGMTEDNIPGSIRYDGVDFQGYSSEGWKSLTKLNEDPTQFQDNLGNHSAVKELDMASNYISNLKDPQNLQHAATKGYVDGHVDSLSAIIDSLEVGGSNFDIENIELVTQFRKDNDPNLTGPVNELKIETSDGDYSINLNFMRDGWSYYVPTQNSSAFPTIWNDDIFVGIGVEEATADLEIGRFATTRFRANSGNLVDFKSKDEGLAIDFYNPGGGQPSPNLAMEFFGNTSFDFDIANKKLGIGVEDPQEELDMEGTLQIKKNSSSGNPHLNIIEDDSDYVRINMTNSSNKNIAMVALPSATQSSSKINFNIAGAGDVLTIAGNDRIGINDNSPDYTLDVEAQGGANPLRVGTSSASNTYLKILENGDVGLGDDPDSDVHIHHENGGSTRGLRMENKGTTASGDHWRFYVSQGGDLRLYNNTSANSMGKFNKSTGAYTSTSDRRLKDKINDLHFQWDKFMSLKPSNYFFKSDQKKRTQLGLIAQDVEQVYPEIVYKDEETGMYKMDYSGTGVIAIKAVQELKKENQDLESKLNELTKEIQELKKLIKEK